MRLCRFWMLKWGNQSVTGTVVVPPKRRRQFVMKEGRQPWLGVDDEGSNSARNTDSSSIPLCSKSSVARELSQRERYRLYKAQEAEDMCRRGIPGEWLSPMPKRYGLYDGIDEHGYEAARLSVKERRQALQAALERNAASVVEFTEGGEEDIDMGGMPASDFHGQTNCTTIPKESALYNAVMAGGELDSRRRSNSWNIARQRQYENTASFAADGTSESVTNMKNNDERSVIDEKRRRRRDDEGSYTNIFDESLLEPNYESIGQPRSTYGMRKMFVAGLTGYEGVITREEEARICDELLHLLQDRRAAYIAEETRYCVNLYEKELGVPGKDSLAFAMSQAPTLQRVLERFFYLGLIPSLPNICQVNEMIGNFSGYPVHKKPATIGPYVGILNLVSTTVMHLQHLDTPWFPRLHINPRSLFVVEHPCLGDYKMGYKWTHHPFHTFEYATRVSKDYRIEVMFATVEALQMRYLKDAVGITEYAEKKQKKDKDNVANQGFLSLSPTSSLPSSLSPNNDGKETVHFFDSSDRLIERLSRQLHAAGDGCGVAGEKNVVIDGNALREQLLASGCIGEKSRLFDASAKSGETKEQPVPQMSQTQRRMAALKARYEFAKRLKEEKPQVSFDGVCVIEGHSPRKGSPF